MTADPSLPVSEQADALAVGRRLGTGERNPQYRASMLVPVIEAGTPRASGFWSIASGGSFTEVAAWVGFVTAPVAYWGLRWTAAHGTGLTLLEWEIRLNVPAASLLGVVVDSGTWTTAAPLDIEFGDANLFNLPGVGPRIFTERLSLGLWLRGTGGTGEPVGWRAEDGWRLQAN